MRCVIHRAMIASLLCASASTADELIYAFEGDAWPHSVGWEEFNPCTGPCTDGPLDGIFVLTWLGGVDFVNYHRWYSDPIKFPSPEPPFWLETRFASTEPLGNNPGCDASLVIEYRNINTLVDLFGDSVLSDDSGTVRQGFALGEFRTVRFESGDGECYCFSVAGRQFVCRDEIRPDDGYNYFQLFGHGGCSVARQPTINKWDYVRFGRITYGEQIVSSDPPQSFLDARTHAALNRFAVIFDEPNHVMVTEIDVQANSLRIPPSAVTIPEVYATGRRDNALPEEVEIVLGQPIAYGATTRFTFDDGVAVNVVEYTFAPGDTDGDGDADLADYSWLQNCAGVPLNDGNRNATSSANSLAILDSPFSIPLGPCLALDSDENAVIDHFDHADFLLYFSNPSP